MYFSDTVTSQRTVMLEGLRKSYIGWEGEVFMKEGDWVEHMLSDTLESGTQKNTARDFNEHVLYQ